jgi:hypothetical protein
MGKNEGKRQKSKGKRQKEGTTAYSLVLFLTFAFCLLPFAFCLRPVFPYASAGAVSLPPA